MNPRILRGPGLALGLALSMTAMAQRQADQRPDNETAPVPIRVAMTGSYWPLHIDGLDERQRYGLEADLAQMLASELGTSVTYLTREEIGPGGSLKAVAEGRADIAINAITPTDERRALVDFTAPYLALQFRIATQAATPPASVPGTLESFAGKKGAAPKGLAYDIARAKLPTAKLQAVTGMAAGAKLLKARKIDFLVGEDVGLAEVVDQNPGLVLLPLSLAPSSLAAAVPKGGAAKYDAALARLAPAISRLQQLYRPGSSLAPKDLFITNCRPGEGEDRGFGHVSVEGAPEAKAGPAPPDQSWYFFDENLTGAPAADHASPLDSTVLCVSAPVRVTPTPPPGGQAALTKAIARLRKQAPRASWEVAERAGAWFRLADGGFGTAVRWSHSGGCPENVAVCDASGYLVLVVKGRQSASSSFVVREEEVVEGT